MHTFRGIERLESYLDRSTGKIPHSRPRILPRISTARTQFSENAYRKGALSTIAADTLRQFPL